MLHFDTTFFDPANAHLDGYSTTASCSLSAQRSEARPNFF
jgi:hypothetical protein